MSETTKKTAAQIAEEAASVKPEKVITVVCVNGQWTTQFETNGSLPVTARDLKFVKRAIDVKFKRASREGRMKQAIERRETQETLATVV